MSGGRVWDAYRDGKIDEIRAYCETDVLNTYLIYLQFEKLRGKLDESGHTRGKRSAWWNCSANPGKGT